MGALAQVLAKRLGSRAKMGFKMPSPMTTSSVRMDRSRAFQVLSIARVLRMARGLRSFSSTVSRCTGSPALKEVYCKGQQVGDYLRSNEDVDECAVGRLFTLMTKRPAEELDAQSDFSSYDPLLLDQPPYKYNYNYWLVLLLYRRSAYGDLGVEQTWTALRDRKYDLPVTGNAADILWTTFLRTALHDHQKYFDEFFLKRVTNYAVGLSKRKLIGKKGLYEEVMLHILKHFPSKTMQWHNLMYPEFKDYVDLPSFIERATGQIGADDKKVLEAFLSLVECLPSNGVYSALVPALCKHGFHMQALIWHHKLLQIGDIPQSSVPANGLFNWASIYGSYSVRQELLLSLNKAGVPLEESSAIAMVPTGGYSNRCKEALWLILNDPRYSFPAQSLGDSFWSHIFDTSIGLRACFRMMSGWNKDKAASTYVGEQTIQKVMVEMGIGYNAALDLLYQTNLPVVTRADLDRELVEQLEREARAESEKKAQEEEQRQKEASFWDPTNILVLCTVYPYLAPQGNDDTIPSPLRLTKHQIRSNTHSLLRPRIPGKHARTNLPAPITFKMPLNSPFRPCLITPNPIPVNDVLAAIHYLLLLLHANYRVPPELFRELFIRLGQARRLSLIETLTFEILKSPPFRTSETTIPSRSKSSLFRRLFPKQRLAAFVEWGFIYGRRWWLSRKQSRYWGISLVRKLRDFGVHVDPKTIRKAVQTRLLAALGEWRDFSVGGRRFWKINKDKPERLRKTMLKVVLRDCEIAWGEPLWGMASRSERAKRRYRSRLERINRSVIKGEIKPSKKADLEVDVGGLEGLKSRRNSEIFTILRDRNIKTQVLELWMKMARQRDQAVVLSARARQSEVWRAAESRRREAQDLYYERGGRLI